MSYLQLGTKQINSVVFILFLKKTTKIPEYNFWRIGQRVNVGTKRITGGNSRSFYV
jgi:hypothetical protein